MTYSSWKQHWLRGAGLSLVLFCVLPCEAGISPSYYDAVDTSTASLLRSTLNSTLSTGEVQLGYDNTWTPLRDIDEATTLTTHVRLIYGGDLREKDAGTDSDGSPVTGGWNREHIFPQSFFNQDEPMRSDVHALFPSDTDVNTRRSNYPYDSVASPTYQDVLGNKGTSSLFEPADVDKGRVARAVLYMDVRYEGLNGEPDLTVTNSYPGGTGAGQMAFLETLLEWHRQYPPDALERARNYKAYRYQQNANPFVDHPEWVDNIYGEPAWQTEDSNILTLAADGPATGSIAAGSAEVPALVIPTETMGQEVHLASLSILKTGTLPDSEVAQVVVWYDVDADGAVSPEDSKLAGAAFSGGAAEIQLSHPFYFASGFNQLLVTVDVPVWATAGATLSVTIPEASLKLSPTGGIDSVTPFEALTGNEHTVGNPTDPAAGLIISEVFEGSQGNLKYVELYNGTSETINLAASGVSLRRYTNGNTDPTNLSLPAGSISPGDAFVIANNATDFTTAFGFAPDATDSNISHNGNDFYELYRASSGLILDTFAGDRVGLSADFAVDRVAHRRSPVLPNSGDWGAPAVTSPPDGAFSPSGYWRIRTVTAGNANAQQVGTPGELSEPVTAIGEWVEY